MVEFKYNRYSIRLTGYDYSKPGYYFITLVTQNRDRRFGVIRNKKMQLNNAGKMINREWNQIPKRFKYAVLDKYIIMPNHFHGIIKIIPNNNPQKSNKNTIHLKNTDIHPKKTSVLDIVGAFKSITTCRYIDGVKNKNWPRFNKRLWQLRFYDRIIRTENDLSRISKYIIKNPYNYHTNTK